MTSKGIARSASDYAVYDPMEPATQPIIAEACLTRLMTVTIRSSIGIDGRSHYVDVGKGAAVEPVPESAIVHIEPKRAEPRTVDRTVAEIAAANGGRYGIDIHLRHHPSTSEASAETHVRRLEAIRRASGDLERDADGRWTIPPDHLDRAVA